MSEVYELETTKLYEDNFLVVNPRLKIYINRGGTRSSKTYTLLQGFANWLMTGGFGDGKYRDYGIVSIVRKHGATVTASCQRDFEEILEPMLEADGLILDKIRNKTDKTYKIGKRIVEFFGAEDSQKTRGSKRHILYCNEANELNYKSQFFQLLIRTKERVYIDFNPDDESCWINQELELKRRYTKKDVRIIISTYKDNPFLSNEEVEEIENIKNVDEQLRKIYGLGEYGKIEGLVFPNVQVIDEIPDTAKYIGDGLDFGFTNDPTALISVYKHDNAIILDELLYHTGLTNQDILSYMKDFGFTKENREIFADSSEPKSIEEIYRGGMNIKPAEKGPDSIKFGIDIMKKYQIYVTARSVNLLKEFRAYIWKLDKNGNSLNVPIDKFNHGIDASRYLISMKLRLEKNDKPGMWLGGEYIG